MKKVLLIVIDALASRVIVPAIEAGRLPCFAALIERGTLRTECTSIFPSITPAATASIVTGVYPCDHQIAGAFWYERDSDAVAYYGDDFWVVIQEGVDEFVNDFLVRLNHDRLNAKTLYQRVERHGLTAAAVNYMWFRGETRHEVNAPLLLKLLPGVTFADQVLGPKVLAMADFVQSKLPGRDEPLHASGGMKRRYGFHDDTTADYLLQLAEAEPFPDFTLAYFPNNDFDSHDKGPSEAVSTVEEVDRHLGEFIQRRGGLNRFLDEFAILISGDHSQTDLIRDRSGRGIDLVEILADYQLADAGKSWQPDDDLMVCPNMRACHIYLKDRSSANRDAVTRLLLNDLRIDQVMWRESSWNKGQPVDHIEPASDLFHIATAADGTLSFHHAESPATARGRDAYGTSWTWQGDLGCVGAKLTAAGDIVYNEYPNALERIATGFCDLTADLWITAKPGCEFAITATSIHSGGSHGALNKDDSTAPLIVAGFPDSIAVPDAPRTIDLAPLCLRALGLDAEAADLINSRVAGAL